MLVKLDLKEFYKLLAMTKNKKYVLGILAFTILISGLNGSVYCEKRGPLATSTATPQRTVIVTSTADSGPGTLRQALLEAQRGDIITFDPTVFPPNAPATIAVMTELPFIQQGNLFLDASQAGVILDGSHVPGEWVAGLQIVSSEANTIWGLQVSHFPGPGIAISGDSKHNVIGGDRSLGAGPFGRGNLFSNNKIGIDLSTNGATLNTVTGNLVGTDTEGTDSLGNDRDGVSITEGAHSNTIGPDNIFAYNNAHGIKVQDPNSFGNTILQNSIHDNGEEGIHLVEGGNKEFPTPIITDFDLSLGTLTGFTYANCTVEIFSDSSDEGQIYEGQTTTDGFGVFTFVKGTSFTGPHLTATATDDDGNTSEFSVSTSGTRRSTNLQEGNNLPKTQLQSKQSRELEDNHIATQFDSFGFPEELSDLGNYRSGFTRARVAIAGLEPELVDWDKPEFSIDPIHDDVFTRMAENGLTITYVLTFWDKATYPIGEGAPCARFKTEGEIERYLEFVRFIVDHFKDRVQYYEIWNEPDIREYCPKWIESAEYINLVKRTVPVIREVYPEAKIVVGGVSNTRFSNAYDYMFDLLESDIMPLVDVIAWHPMYGTSPEYDLYEDYYYEYPAMVQRIKETAAANGFVGEYRVDELTWSTPSNAIPDQPWIYSETASAKYYARGIMMHLGMNVTAGLGGTSHVLKLPKMRVIRNLCTIMAGAEPVSLPVEIQSEVTNIRSYSFSLSNNDTLIALWTDGVAVDEDPGVKAEIKVSGFTDWNVMGIDTLRSFQQPIASSSENGDMVIQNLIVRDYPLILRLTTAPEPTLISISLLATTINRGESVTLSGSISPAISEAMVHLTYRKAAEAEVERTVTTAPDGSFSDTYTPDAAGSWNVKASWEGDREFEGSTSSVIHFTVTITPSSISIQTSESQITEGDSVTVSGSINPAVSGAEVVIAFTKPDGSTSTRTISTGSDGSYSELYIPTETGSWSIKASWEGDETYSGATSQTLEFNVVEAPPPSSLKIIVKDENGNPVSGATVSSTSQPSSQQSLSGSSGTDGSVLFSDVKSGSYTFQARKSEYVTQSGSVSAKAGETAELTITLEKEAPPEEEKKGCIIATATYGSELAPEVQFLRGFRDNTVLNTFAGRSFMTVFNTWYYSFSPGVASTIAVNEALRGFMKILLYPLIGILQITASMFSLFSFNHEFAIVTSGLIASSLIGVIYIAPIALILHIIKNVRVHPKTLRIGSMIWVISLGGIVASEITRWSTIMMFSTAIFVLITMILVTLSSVKYIARHIQY